MEDIVHSGAARRTVLTANMGGTTSDLTLYASPPLTGWAQPTGDQIAYLIVNKTGSTPEKMFYSGINIVTGEITIWSEGLSTGRAADGTSIAQHFTGEAVEHVWTATEANALVNHVNSDEAHGSDGDVVGQNTLNTAVADLEADIAAASALAIPKSIIDATGDLIVGSGADTPVRVAVGDAGDVLTVASGTAAWVEPSTVFVKSYAPSAASSLSFDNGTFVAGYDYELTITGTITVAGLIGYRMRAAGVDASGPDYCRVVLVNGGGAVSDTGQTSGYVGTAGINTTGLEVVVYGPADAIFTGLWGHGVVNGAGGGVPNLVDAGMEHRLAVAYDSMTLFFPNPFTGVVTVKRLRRT